MIHGYGRVSTLGQAGEDKTSIEEQERLVRAAALVRGEPDPRIWLDRGVSGSVPLTKRPEGGEMLREIRATDLIISTKLDRLFRSASDALVTAEELHSRNIDIMFLEFGSEPVMSSLSGRLFFQMLAAFAEFERGRIRERITDGKRAARARGGRPGGTTPYGYAFVNGQWKPVEGELWLIHRARVLRAGGYSEQAIADNLNAAGYRTRNGTKFQQRQIGRWLKRPAIPEEAAATQPPIPQPALEPAL